MLVRLSWLFLLAVAACDRSEAQAPAGAPKAEERTESVTVWGDRFEVFLEHRLIVVGKPVKFAAHITDQKTLEPRRKDPVVFVLTQGTEPPIRHEESAPKSPGIYQPELVFPKAGDWKVTLEIPVDGTTSVVALPPFRAYASMEEAEKSPEPESPEGMSFTKEQQWKVLTKTDAIGKRRLVERMRVPTMVTARPGGRAAVVAPVAGRVLPLPGKSLPSIGDKVETGQTLALVQPPFSDFAAKIVEANAEVVRTKLALDQATLVLERTRKLAALEARTARDLQESEYAVRSAQAATEAALALKSTYEKAGAVVKDGLPILELKSPISGTLTAVAAAIGEHVGTERPIFTVLDSRRVYLEAKVPEADLWRLGAPKAALLENPAYRGSFIPLEGKATLVLAAPEVDVATRTASMLYEIDNGDGALRIGMALTLHLETARAEETLAIPASAVLDEDAKPIAFVQVSGETFQKRSLRLGIRDGAWVQVLDGLSEGERVVTKEAFAIRLASVSSVIPAHGHAH